MDIQRTGVVRQRHRRRSILGGIILLAVAGVSMYIGRLPPALETVDRGEVWIATVEQGTLIRQVTGPGNLVPEEIRWVSPDVDGRVERICEWPGTTVTADTVLLELSSRELQDSVASARAQLRTAEIGFTKLKSQLQTELLTSESTCAQAGATLERANLLVQADEELFKRGLQTELAARQSRINAVQAAKQDQIERRRATQLQQAHQAQIDGQMAEIAKLQNELNFAERRVASLRVRSGVAGMLQEIKVDVGARVSAGANVARVANPMRLKAQLRIPESQAQDVQVGQSVTIDTRNGLIAARVSRIDPAVQEGTRTVDASLDGPLPRGAVPDLSVDGAIELERLERAVFVGRPTYAQENSTISLFRLDATGTLAWRTQVRLGRTSTSAIEIREGLKPGDKVILSDMSSYQSVERVRVR